MKRYVIIDRKLFNENRSLSQFFGMSTDVRAFYLPETNQTIMAFNYTQYEKVSLESF